MYIRIIFLFRIGGRYISVSVGSLLCAEDNWSAGRFDQNLARSIGIGVGSLNMRARLRCLDLSLESLEVDSGGCFNMRSPSVDMIGTFMSWMMQSEPWSPRTDKRSLTLPAKFNFHFCCVRFDLPDRLFPLEDFCCSVNDLCASASIGDAAEQDGYAAGDAGRYHVAMKLKHFDLEAKLRPKVAPLGVEDKISTVELISCDDVTVDIEHDVGGHLAVKVEGSRLHVLVPPLPRALDIMSVRPLPLPVRLQRRASLGGRAPRFRVKMHEVDVCLCGTTEAECAIVGLKLYVKEINITPAAQSDVLRIKGVEIFVGKYNVADDDRLRLPSKIECWPLEPLSDVNKTTIFSSHWRRHLLSTHTRPTISVWATQISGTRAGWLLVPLCAESFSASVQRTLDSTVITLTPIHLMVTSADSYIFKTLLKDINCAKLMLIQMLQSTSEGRSRLASSFCDEEILNSGSSSRGNSWDDEEAKVAEYKLAQASIRVDVLDVAGLKRGFHCDVNLRQAVVAAHSNKTILALDLDRVCRR